MTPQVITSGEGLATDCTRVAPFPGVYKSVSFEVSFIGEHLATRFTRVSLCWSYLCAAIYYC